MDRFSVGEIEREDTRLYQELNTTMDNSDRLVRNVLVLQVFLVIIGSGFKDTASTAGRLGIIVGFGLIATQCMYAAKIHRIGSYFKHSGSVWENANRSPLVGIFGTMVLLASLVVWAWSILLWYPTYGTMFTDNDILNAANFVTLIVIALSVGMVIFLPFIPRIEERYNKPRSRPM